MKRTLFATSLALFCGGCIGVPNPLAPELKGSVGVPHSGVLTGAVELAPKGKGYVRYRPKSPNYWGNPRLIAAIEQAAASVADALPGGAPLVVGDISARAGGQLPGHHSHRTGRDADLLLYVMTPSGASMTSPGWVKIESDGLGEIQGGDLDGTFVRLDVERQWLLVKNLVKSDEAQMQFFFVSRNIEALLVDYARARGEPLELVWRAETMMLQPGDSTPHDDHMHVRIACLPDEAVDGCEGGGPRWEWLKPTPVLGPLDATALEAIASDDPLAIESATAAREGGGV